MKILSFEKKKSIKNETNILENLIYENFFIIDCVFYVKFYITHVLVVFNVKFERKKKVLVVLYVKFDIKNVL